jgi:hypothetical protein
LSRSLTIRSRSDWIRLTPRRRGAPTGESRRIGRSRLLSTPLVDFGEIFLAFRFALDRPSRHPRAEGPHPGRSTGLTKPATEAASHAVTRPETE